MDKKELTKYERASVLGKRAEQLSSGAQPTIEVPVDITEPIEIARLELIQKRSPIIIRRVFPDGSIIDISVNDLVYSDN